MAGCGELFGILVPVFGILVPKAPTGIGFRNPPFGDPADRESNLFCSKFRSICMKNEKKRNFTILLMIENLVCYKHLCAKFRSIC